MVWKLCFCCSSTNNDETTTAITVEELQQQQQNAFEAAKKQLNRSIAELRAAQTAVKTHQAAVEEQAKKLSDSEAEQLAQWTELRDEQQKWRSELRFARLKLLEERRQFENAKDRELVKLAQEQQKLKLTAQESEARFADELVQQESQANLEFLNSLRAVFKQRPLARLPDQPFKEYEQKESSTKYNSASMMFTRTNKNCFTITKISSVANGFQVLHYHLMEQKYILVFGDPCNHRMMFHGTKLENLKDISTWNFDRSKVITHKYGQGVSFARDAYYATHYPHENKNKVDKVMVIAKVLVGKSQLGHPAMAIPDEPLYTSANHDGSVIVKYDDASFYPVHIVYYAGLHPPGAKKGNR